MKIKKGLIGCWYFFWGHIFAWLYYDKKYLSGRWFNGKLKGLCATGWRWVTVDGFFRLFHRQNLGSKYPIGYQMRVINPDNVYFEPNELNNLQGMGIYLQAIGKIYIGGVLI